MEFYNFAGEESSRKLTSIKQSLLGTQVSNANYAIEILVMKKKDLFLLELLSFS